MEAFTLSQEQDPWKRSTAQAVEQHLNALEHTRPHLVRVILRAREACEKANSTDGPKSSRAANAQRLLSAAVQDLETLDNRLTTSRDGM